MEELDPEVAQLRLGEAGRLDDADREMKLAEKSGLRVNPQFKEDLKKASSRR